MPQKRNRFFCIGALGAVDNFLLDRIFQQYIQEEISVRGYFEANHIPLNIDAYYRHPTTYKRRAIFSVDAVAPTVRGVNRPKPATYQRHEIDAVPENEMENVRQLTYRERAAIQTFPEDFVFEGLGLPNGDVEQMIGNAVPVGMAQFVANCLQRYIEQHQGGHNPMDNRQTFSEWLRTEKKYTDRSISDVFSRLHRAAGILPNHDMNIYYITDLEQTPEYQNLGVDVRSQIRKAINLNLAFLRHMNEHE